MLRSSLVIVLLATSCQSASVDSRAYGRASSISETRIDKAVKGRPTFGDPLPIPGTSVRLIPFSRESTVGWFGDKDHFAEGGLSQLRVAQPMAPRGGQIRPSYTRKIRWHNAAVHDLGSGEQWTLLRQRGILSRFWMRLDSILDGDGNVLHQENASLIFAATTEDTNGDQRLDDKDDVRALVADPDGRNPRFVTPEGTQLVDVQFDGEFEVAIFMLRVDLNDDGEFSTDEPPRPFLYRLGEDRASPLLEKATLDLIEGALE